MINLRWIKLKQTYPHVQIWHELMCKFLETISLRSHKSTNDLLHTRNFNCKEHLSAFYNHSANMTRLYVRSHSNHQTEIKIDD